MNSKILFKPPRGRIDQGAGILDGKQVLASDWKEPISGHVGVWSKADSVVYIDDFTVNPTR